MAAVRGKEDAERIPKDVYGHIDTKTVNTWKIKEKLQGPVTLWNRNKLIGPNPEIYDEN